MNGDMIRLNVIQPRLMTKSEAARYLGVSIKRFPVCCPVNPIALPGGNERYDRFDLDAWLDGQKAGCADSDDDIVGKLG